MQRGADLQVFRAVIDKVNLAVAGAVETAQTSGVGAVVAAVVKDRAVFVAVDVDGVEPAGIAQSIIRTVHGIVVVRHPIVRAETEGIDLEAQHRVVLLVGDVVGIPETGLCQVALTGFGAHADTGETEGDLVSMDTTPLKAPGP